MGKLWAIVKREYLERLRSKWYLISTVLAPLFFGVVIIVPIVITSRTKASPDLSHVVILDATGTQLGVRVAGELAGGISADASRAEVRAVAPSELAAAESTATRDVMRMHDPMLGYLVLDSGTLAGKTDRYAGRNASSLLDVKEIEEAVRRSLLAQRLEHEGLQPSRIKDLTNVSLDMKSERLSERGREVGGFANALFSYLLAFLLYTMLVIYGQQILRGVMEEKTSRVAEVVISSVSTDTLLAGKVSGSRRGIAHADRDLGVHVHARVQRARNDPRALRHRQRADSHSAHRTSASQCCCSPSSCSASPSTPPCSRRWGRR